MRPLLVHLPVLLLLLLLFEAQYHTAAAAPHQQRPKAATATATAASPNSTVLVDTAEAARRPVVLQTLFNVDLDTIVFTAPNFTLLPDAWAYVSADTPYVLDRNFTIRSQLQPGTVMDWTFLDKKTVVQPGTTFSFDSLVLVDTRALNTLYFDWFVNSPGAVLTISNCIMIDPVCNAISPAEDLTSAQSLPQLPQQRRNLVSTALPFCMALPNGTECFQHGVLLQDVAVVLASDSRQNCTIAASAASAAKAAAAGHFIIQYRNTTRVCRQYLDPQYLQENGGNRSYCWQQAVRVLTGAGTNAAGGSSGGASAGVVAGAVVGGVAGLLAILAAILLLLRRHRQRRRPRGDDIMGGSSSKDRTASLLSGSRDGSSPDTRPHRPDDQTDQTEGPVEDSARGIRVSGGLGLAQLPPQASGRLSNVSTTCASFGRDGLHLGVLLGVGSYGRVYKGRWHGQDVATKIIHCLPEELPRVLREAEIMLQLDHPNVVRALNCIVQQNPASKAADPQPGSSRPARPFSSGSSSGASSSRKNSATSSINRMLPVLNGSQGTSSFSPSMPISQGALSFSPSMPIPTQAVAGRVLGVGSSSLDGSATGSWSGSNLLRQPLTAAAGDALQQQGYAAVPAGGSLQQLAGQQHQGQASAQQEVHVLPAAAMLQQGQVAAHQEMQVLPVAAMLQQLAKQQQQQQAPAQQEVQVLPVLTTGSEVGETSSSATPDSALPVRQQQQPGTDPDDDGCGDDGAERVGEVWLVLELCTGGSVQDSFKHHGDAFEMARLLCRLAEVAQGMAYLHTKQIIHGDLKAANVLLVNSIHGSFGQIAKLTDFGLAGVLRDGITHHSTQNLGTVSHCAPEVLAAGHVSPAADVYAFGIMMWELLTTRTAFKNEHYGSIIQQVVEGGRRPTIPTDAPEDYALLMEACWANNPAARPTFEQVLECLSIMLQSLDAVTTASNLAAGRSPRMSMEEARDVAAAADAEAEAITKGGEDGGGGGAAAAASTAREGGSAAAVGVGGRSNSSKVGSFDICRSSSLGSSQQGTSSTAAGLSLMHSAASRGSSDLDAAAAGAAPGTSPSGGPHRSMGTWYARKSPLQPAVGAAAGPPSIASQAMVSPPSSGMMGAAAPSHFIPQQQHRVATASVLAPLAEQDAAAAADQLQWPGRLPAAAAAGGGSSCSISFSTRGTPAVAAAVGEVPVGAAGKQLGPGLLAVRALGGGDAGGVHKGGSACSAGSGGSSTLGQLQAPSQSRHIQDLW